MGWWAGENMMDVAIYINDARALQLTLIGGQTGAEVEGHDWEHILIDDELAPPRSPDREHRPLDRRRDDDRRASCGRAVDHARGRRKNHGSIARTTLIGCRRSARRWRWRPRRRRRRRRASRPSISRKRRSPSCSSGWRPGRTRRDRSSSKYLARIEAIDSRGPALRSVIEINPDARAIADALDAERKSKGARAARSTASRC